MIQLIVDVYNSRIDRNGNTYWGFGLTDTATRQTLAFKTGGSGSNATYWLRELGFEWEDLHSTEHELPIRQFERMVKQWPYAHNAEMVAEAMNAEGFRARPSGRPRPRR